MDDVKNWVPERLKHWTLPEYVQQSSAVGTIPPRNSLASTVLVPLSDYLVRYFSILATCILEAFICKSKDASPLFI